MWKVGAFRERTNLCYPEDLLLLAALKLVLVGTAGTGGSQSPAGASTAPPGVLWGFSADTHQLGLSCGTRHRDEGRRFNLTVRH